MDTPAVTPAPVPSPNPALAAALQELGRARGLLDELTALLIGGDFLPDEHALIRLLARRLRESAAGASIAIADALEERHGR